MNGDPAFSCDCAQRTKVCSTRIGRRSRYGWMRWFSTTFEANPNATPRLVFAMSVETINVPVKSHRRTPRPRELCWVVWRQHRGLLAASTATVALLSASLVLAAVQLHGVHCASADQCVLSHHRLFTSSRWLLTASVFGFPTAIGAFWGAPLVAREFETGTHTLTFGQDLSPRQWLVGKAAILGGLAAGLGLVLWIPARM